MTLVRLDTVQRANVPSGFGTATDGNVWNSLAGDGQSVSGNAMILANSTASTFAVLGPSLPGPNAEVLLQFSPGGTDDTAGALLRVIDVNNYYLARDNGLGAVEFFKNVAGTKTVVGSFAFTFGFSFFWLRFRAQGSSISIRAWLDGNAEPLTWNYTATDTSLSGAGGNACGLYGFANPSEQNAYTFFSVDNLASLPDAGVAPMVPHHRFAYLS